MGRWSLPHTSIPRVFMGRWSFPRLVHDAIAYAPYVFYVFLFFNKIGIII